MKGRSLHASHLCEDARDIMIGSDTSIPGSMGATSGALGISVVIPLYNGARWIGQTLEHLLKQQRKVDEIIVVDDHSTDHSAAIVKTYPGVTLTTNPGKGGGDARDHGLRLSSYPLIAFFDQDDLPSPTHFERLTSILETRPDAVAAVAIPCPFRQAETIEFGDHEPLLTRDLDPWINYPFGTIECPSQVLLRKSVLTATGTWKQQTFSMADLELWHRVANEGKVVVSDTVTLARRVHASSLSGKFRKNINSYLSALVSAANSLARDRATDSRYDYTDFPLEARREISTCAQSVVLQLSAGEIPAAGSALADLLGQLKKIDCPGHRGVALANLLWFVCPDGMPYSMARIMLDFRDWILRELPEAADFAASITSHAARWPTPWHLALWINSPGNPDRRRMLLNRLPLVRKPETPAIHWRGNGIDSDGWAKQQATLVIPAESRRGALHIDIEHHAAAICPSLDLTVNVHSLPKVRQAKDGNSMTLLVPPVSDVDQDLRIHFECHSPSLELGDKRVRYYRIAAVRHHEGVSDISAVTWL